MYVHITDIMDDSYHNVFYFGLAVEMVIIVIQIALIAFLGVKVYFESKRQPRQLGPEIPHDLLRTGPVEQHIPGGAVSPHHIVRYSCAPSLVKIPATEQNRKIFLSSDNIQTHTTQPLYNTLT
jgi:hypothetical protein